MKATDRNCKLLWAVLCEMYAAQCWVCSGWHAGNWHVAVRHDNGGDWGAIGDYLLDLELAP